MTERAYGRKLFRSSNVLTHQDNDIYLEFSPAFYHRICPSYFDTYHKPATLSSVAHASQASVPPQTASIPRPCALPTSDLSGLAAPLLPVLSEVDNCGLGRRIALGARP
jgi:hypothetical protein